MSFEPILITSIIVLTATLASNYLHQKNHIALSRALIILVSFGMGIFNYVLTKDLLWAAGVTFIIFVLYGGLLWRRRGSAAS